jgi:nitrile hydratase accessory protein
MSNDVREDQDVFKEPWEAHAFAMTVQLQARGLFTWDEWTRTLAAKISAAQAAGDPDSGENYYRHWLAALEAIVEGKGLTSADERLRYAQAWDHAADRTPHGQPIELEPKDFRHD